MQIKTQDPKYDIKLTMDDSGRVTGACLVNAQSGDPIPVDEPVFMLRGQDVHAYRAIVFYAGSCCNYEHQAAVLQRANEFEQFGLDHPERMKEPDTPDIYGIARLMEAKDIGHGG